MPIKYINPGRLEFDGKLNREEGGGTFVNFPHDVEKLYGVKGRVPVNVTSLDRRRQTGRDAETADREGHRADTRQEKN